MNETSTNIKKESIMGTIWKLLERFSAKAVSLVVSIVLARLLTPDDYSVVGIVSIFFTFANVFITGGFNTALIQKKEVDEIDYFSVLCLSLFIALVMYVILFFCAPFIAYIYKQDILTLVIRVMGLTLFVSAFKSILCVHISRNLQFKKLFFSTIGGIIASAIVGIFLAIKGCGPWALVAQQMTNVIIDTIILIFTTKFRIVSRFSLTKLKILFKYGWKIFISSIISVVYDEINPLVIGLKYSGADLAYYSKGNSFPSLIYRTVGDTLSSVFFPVMSKFQDDKKKMLDITRRFMGIASFLIFPMMIGFLAAAENFVAVILTEKWLSAAIYIKIFCVVYMLNMINIGNVQVIQAAGRSDILLIIEIIKKVIYFSVIILFLLFTNTPEMLAVACVINAVFALIINMFPNRKLIGYRYRLQIMDLLPNLFASILMGIVVYFVGKIAIGKVVLLLLQIVVGGISYVVINLLIKNSNLVYCFSTLKSLLKRKKTEVQ